MYKGILCSMVLVSNWYWSRTWLLATFFNTFTSGVHTRLLLCSTSTFLHRFLCIRGVLLRFCVIYIGECGSTLYVGLAHAVPPSNTKFKPLLLLTQVGMPYTNTHKHRKSYCKSTLMFLGPAKRWKSICAARQKPEIRAVLHHNIKLQDLLF